MSDIPTYEIWCAAAAVNKIGGRVVILRVVVRRDRARVVRPEVGVVVASRIFRQDLDQLREEVVCLKVANLKIKSIVLAN